MEPVPVEKRKIKPDCQYDIEINRKFFVHIGIVTNVLNIAKTNQFAVGVVDDVVDVGVGVSVK